MNWVKTDIGPKVKYAVRKNGFDLLDLDLVSEANENI